MVFILMKIFMGNRGSREFAAWLGWQRISPWQRGRVCVRRSEASREQTQLRLQVSRRAEQQGAKPLGVSYFDKNCNYSLLWLSAIAMPGLGYRQSRTVTVLVFGFWFLFFATGLAPCP